jgi:acetyl-CoA acetyltransferase
VTSSDRVFIVGTASTEFSKASGRSELRLALEAISGALADAGIAPDEVDGFVSNDQDNNSESALSRNLGTTKTTFFARSPMGGGGGCGALALARMAIVTGAAEVVVCYRAMNERSEDRFGLPAGGGDVGGNGGPATSWDLDMSWCEPFGLGTPAGWIALSARRYMHEQQVTSEDFGRVSVLEREYAATNPAAWFYKRPITLEDHQASRTISDPLRLLDCCQESDGGVAFVLTNERRARALQTRPVELVAGAQAIGPQQVGMASPYQENIATAIESQIIAAQLWEKAALQPDQMDVAILYDHFSFSVLMQLEDLGFCRPGEAKHWVKEGALRLDGRLPTNTHGGQLGEAYVHGFNGIAEAVRQLRGTAANQVNGANTALVTSGSHVPTSGIILRGA